MNKQSQRRTQAEKFEKFHRITSKRTSTLNENEISWKADCRYRKFRTILSNTIKNTEIFRAQTEKNLFSTSKQKQRKNLFFFMRIIIDCSRFHEHFSYRTLNVHRPLNVNVNIIVNWFMLINSWCIDLNSKWLKHKRLDSLTRTLSIKHSIDRKDLHRKYLIQKYDEFIKFFVDTYSTH